MARNGRGLVALLGVLAVAGVAAFFFLSPKPVRAGDIRRDPEAFKGKVVTVAGTVTGGGSIGGALFGGSGGFFLLDDGTGQIGVACEGPAPARGSRVTVRGEVEVAVSVSLPRAWQQAAGLPQGDFAAVVVRAQRVQVR